MKAIGMKGVGKALLGSLLLISLILNLYLAYITRENTKELNAAWRNAILQTAKLADSCSVTPNTKLDADSLRVQAQNLTLFQEKLLAVKTLPYVNKIISQSKMHKLQHLTYYHQKVVENSNEDLLKYSTVYPTNLARLRTVRQAWRKISQNLYTAEDIPAKPDYPRPFNPKAWTKPWGKAVDALDKIEFLPID